MKLLFITERINEQDDDLAFVIQWIEEFIRQGTNVEVICLYKGHFSGSFLVHSMGKERRFGILHWRTQLRASVARRLQFARLLWFIVTLKYDRVFVHLSPVYLTAGSWWWFLTRTPVYLWYTHHAMTIHLRIAALLSKRMFAATPQSLPQYEGNPKKTIVNHGVNIDFWAPEPKLLETEGDRYRLVSVHRLSRSKRLELVIEALTHLPAAYTLSVYGRPLEPAYFEELKKLVKTHKLQGRVTFHGPVPMPELRQVYPRHRLMVNMAYETIDKTMLEGMLYGIYPVTTAGNAKAIGLIKGPAEDTPKAIADFILSGAWKAIPRRALRSHVIEHHSLRALIAKMSLYIRNGT